MLQNFSGVLPARNNKHACEDSGAMHVRLGAMLRPRPAEARSQAVGRSGRIGGAADASCSVFTRAPASERRARGDLRAPLSWSAPRHAAHTDARRHLGGRLDPLHAPVREASRYATANAPSSVRPRVCAPGVRARARNVRMCMRMMGRFRSKLVALSPHEDGGHPRSKLAFVQGFLDIAMLPTPASALAVACL